MGKRILLSDLAKELGLSKTLISMVLNGKGDSIKISKSTQKKVFEKAKELNYTANQFARALRIGKSQTIGLIVPDITNPFYARLAAVIEQQLFNKQYKLLICNTRENEEKEIDLIRNLQARAVEGVILASCLKNHLELVELTQNDFPLILVDRVFKNCPLNSVSTSNFEAGEKVAEHFLHAGIKNIGVFGIKPSHVSSIQERLDGFLEKMKQGGVKKNQVQLFEIPAEQLDDETERNLKKILFPNQQIDGIFALNNQMAISVLKTLKKFKIKIPSDIAVFCFDDLDAFELYSPTVSAVEQQVDEMGSIAVKQILNCINNGVKTTKPIAERLPVKIKLRESTRFTQV